MPDLPDQTLGPTSARPLYKLSFIRRCHQLLACGYAKLRPATLEAEQEPAITGELVRAMKSVQERPDAPRWMVYMHIADDPPVNAPGRFGKKRRRVDIEFERSERGRRPRFQCEAKRLYQSDSLEKYLGEDGLGRFLAGDYSRDEDVAGMLGYVQTRSVADWGGDLRSALDENRTQHEISSSEPLVSANLGASLISAPLQKVWSPPIRHGQLCAAVVNGSDEVAGAAEAEGAMADQLDLVVHSLQGAVG